jgi:hypothetical protein
VIIVGTDIYGPDRGGRDLRAEKAKEKIRPHIGWRSYMGLRFRQSFTLFPAVRLNVGRRGVSASFGVQV